MNKNLKGIVGVFFALVFGMVQFGSVMAKESPCPYSAKSSLRGTVPLTVTLEAPSSQNVSSRAWSWGDKTPSNYEVNVSHTYNSIGEFTFTYVEFYTTGFYCAGQGKVVVVASNYDTTEDQNKDDEGWGGDRSESNSGSTNQNGLGFTSGANSPVVNGNGNVVLVVPQRENVPTAQQSQQLQVTVNIQPDPIVTQKTNWFTAFIHAFLKANEVFLHTLDESWFKPELIK